MTFLRRLATEHDPQVLIISVMTLVIMMGSSVISPVLPLLAQEFGVSYVGAGALVSAFAVGRIPFDFIGGTLVDRVSPRIVASGGAALVTLSAALSAPAQSFHALLWYRLVGGIGSALFVITSMAFLVRTVRPQRMGQVMSFYQSMLLLGVSFGPSVGGLASSYFHSLHAPFWAMAVLSLAVTVMSWRWIGEFPETSSGPLHESGHAAPRPLLTPLLRDWTFLFVGVLTLLVFAIRSGTMLNLMPLFAQTSLGLKETGIGIVQSLCSLANFFVLWHAGRLLDRIGRRRVTLPSLWATVIVILLFPLATTLPLLFAASMAFGVTLGYLGPAPAAIIADITPREASGAVMGLYRMAGDIGLLLGPIAIGWAAEHWGFRAAFLAVAACTALVALMGLNVRETLTVHEGEVEAREIAREVTSARS
jgi:MFS family permease